MSEGIRVPSKEWAEKHKGFKAVICLQHTPTSPEEEELRVGVVMVVEGKDGPQERELWELVRHTGSGGQRRGSLEFRRRSGSEKFSRWSKSIRPGIGSLYRAKKPVLFLSRYLLSEDPTTLPFRSKDKGEQANAQGSSTIESADWKDLGVPQEVGQLIQTASFLYKELNPFVTDCGSDEVYTCFVLDKGRLDAATRHFYEIRKAVLDVLSGTELEREAIIQLCPTLSKYGGSAMAVLNRVLDMDRWCAVVPGVHCKSEIQVYRRQHDRVPSYGLLSDVNCKKCGGSEGQDSLALCDYCGSGVHLDCASPEVKRSFLLASEERRDWFCSKQCATLYACMYDDAQEEDSQARRGISSQQVGLNAAAPGEGGVGSPHTAPPGGEVWSTQQWEQHCAALKAEQKQVQEELVPLMNGNFQVKDHDAAVQRRACWLLDRLEELDFEIPRAERQARAPRIRPDERGKAPLRPLPNLGQETRSDSGSDLSARMQESYHNKRAKTSAHVRDEGLMNAQVEVGGAEQDVGQRVHGTVAVGDCPDAGRQQQQGHIHSSSPQVEMEGEANARSDATPNPIACTPLSRVTANNLAPRVARDLHGDSHNERGGSREGRVDARGNAEQRDADRRMSYTEAQLFPGDASLRWFNKDVRELMNNQNSRCDFLEHLFHTVFPKFVEAAPQDHDAISDLVYELINVEQLSPLNEDLEKKLFNHLRDLHNSLLRSYATMQSRVKQKLLPKTFVLLDRVYSTPKRALTPEKLIVEGEQESVFLPFLEEGS